MRKKTLPFIISFILKLSLPPAAHALDVMGLTRFMPNRLEDAQTTDVKDVNVLGTARFENLPDGERFLMRPSIRTGVHENGQLDLTAPLYLGNAATEESGNLELGGQYQFHPESSSWPGLALAPNVVLPTGPESEALTIELRWVGTKTFFGRLEQPNGQVHLNITSILPTQPQSSERSLRSELSVGYSHRIQESFGVVINALRESRPEPGQAWNLIELGLRAQIRSTRLALGRGFGFGRHSPQMIWTLAIQSDLSH